MHDPAAIPRVTPVLAPSRRAVLASTLALPCAAAVAGLGGCQGGSARERSLAFATLAAAEEDLGRLEAAAALDSAATWSWAQTLAHCAQSIEYSMAGYPASKSRLFQGTVGLAAWTVFAWRGRMSHDLAEPIPGAPPLAADLAAGAAMARLRASIAAFRAWAQPLQPHFAYGPLDKPAYEQAHAMHLANHLAQFVGVPGPVPA